MSHALFMLAAVAATHAAVPPALERAVADYDLAQVKGDRSALQRLLADDYLLVGSGGALETKAEFIDDLTSPNYHLNPFKVLRPILRAWSGGAVEGGVALLSGTSGGQAFSSCLRFVDVWMFRDRRWQVGYSQAAKAAAADCGEGAE